MEDIEALRIVLEILQNEKSLVENQRDVTACVQHLVESVDAGATLLYWEDK